MNSIIKRNLIYILIALIISVIILLTSIPNYLIYMVLFLEISLYLSIYYFRNKKYPYLRQIYVLWVLVTIFYNVFSLSLLSIILSFIIGLFLIIQYFFLRKNKKDKIVTEEVYEVEEVAIVEPVIISYDEIKFIKEVKSLYLNTQVYFMEFKYDKLKEILSEDLYNQYEKQLHQLEKNNRVAIRNNIEFIDFNILESNDESAKVNIGIYEDKYTKGKDATDRTKGIRYESYYELIILKQDHLIIDKINLIYSHSKKES